MLFRSMGTHAMGDLVLMFTVDNMVVSLVENIEENYHKASIGSGGFWNFKAKWKGKYRDHFEPIGDGSLAVNTIRLSNGYTIKLVY